MCRLSRNLGTLTLLELCGPVQACHGTALPFSLTVTSSSHGLQFDRSLIHGRKLNMFEDTVADSGMTFTPKVMLLHNLFQQLLDGKSHSYHGTLSLYVLIKQEKCLRDSQ
jgi:hypothetical protein